MIHFFKKTFLLPIILYWAVIPSTAQPKGFTAVQNINTLQQNLVKNNNATQSISSDFNQVKVMKMLNDKVISKGKFYYKKANRIRIEYNTPFQYLLIMNGGSIIVKDETKISKINMRGSKSLQSANKIMMDCMTGTVFSNKDFSVKSFENNSQYLLQLTPVAASMKSLFSRIDIYLEKSDYSVSKLILNESGGDYTDMSFINRKKNVALNDALFNGR